MRFFALLILLGILTNAEKQTGAIKSSVICKDSAPLHVKIFVSKYKKYSAHIVFYYGLPEKSILAHAALETGWGMRVIGGKNFFNIKAKKHDLHLTLKVPEIIKGKVIKEQHRFKKYNSVYDSFLDYGKVISSYKLPRSCDITYSTLIHKAGFQTDPDAPKKIKTIISRYFL